MATKTLLAIDPGTTQSGYVTMDMETYKPLDFGKLPNDILLNIVDCLDSSGTIDTAVIEMPQFFGANMTAGATVFETCVWVGRFMGTLTVDPKRMYRSSIKAIVTGSARATDAQVRQVLIERFAKHDMKNGKGTKANPDWFYGFRADMWQAYAAGVAYIDDMKEGGNSVY